MNLANLANIKIQVKALFLIVESTKFKSNLIKIKWFNFSKSD